ncbi:hypothetical protein QUF72_03655 [Desulfobacterales bacterium HSG2]|nr:hypothetical protein [Desulfobacterales bacterium HSG2]
MRCVSFSSNVRASPTGEYVFQPHHTITRWLTLSNFTVLSLIPTTRIYLATNYTHFGAQYRA